MNGGDAPPGEAHRLGGSRIVTMLDFDPGEVEQGRGQLKLPMKEGGKGTLASTAMDSYVAVSFIYSGSFHIVWMLSKRYYYIR